MVGISLINICQRKKNKKNNIFIQKKTLLLITSSLKSVKRLFTFNFTMAIDKSWWGTGEKHSFDPFTRSVDSPVQ